MDKKKIVPAFAPFFKEHGYKKLGTNKFYKIENNIAYCFLFERPSIVVYPRHFFLPLYVPSYGYLNISHGSSLVEILKNSTYSLWDDDSTFEPWVERVENCIEKMIFPHFESINTFEKLLKFLGRPKADRGFAQGFVFDVPELQSYTCLMMGDVEMASHYLKCMYETLNRSPYQKHIIELHRKRADRLREIINSSREVQEAFLRDTIRYNKEKYFHIKPKEDQAKP